MKKENQNSRADDQNREDYSLDDILEEFGGWSKQPEDNDQTEEQAAVIINREFELTEESGAITAKTHPEKPVVESGDVDDLFLAAAENLPDENKDENKEEEPQPENTDRGKAIWRWEREKEPEEVAEKPADRPEVPVHSALKQYTKAMRSLRPRMILSFFLCLPICYITLASKMGWWLPPFLSSPEITAAVFLASGIVVCLLCYEIIARTLFDILRLKPGIECLVILSCLASFVDAVLILVYPGSANGLPFCAIPALGICFTMAGTYLRKASFRRTFKTALISEEPYSAVCQQNQWEGKPCFFKVRGTAEGFVSRCEEQDCGEKAFSYYVPLAVCCALVFSVLCWVRNGTGFFWSLSAILAAATPLTGALGFAKPFSALSKRLARSGAALAGWEGALSADGDCGVIITDTDVFPKGTAALNGLKVFGDFPVEQIMTYATSLISCSGSGLAPLFEDLLESQSGASSRVDVFQSYEGGGLGGEIHGDFVLVGSSSFMLLMGVRLPQGTKVKHAVYIVINNELAGIFAINYAPAASVRYSIQAIIKAWKLTPVFATKDFIITPTMIKQRFKVPVDTLEFPTIEERTALSDETVERKGRQVALICRDGLVPFADSIIGARWLRIIARVNTVLNLLGGISGLLLLFLLTYMGAAEAATAANILIYTLMWTVPIFLISAWVHRF